MSGIILAKRQMFDERLYAAYRYTFRTSDFTQWTIYPNFFETEQFWPDFQRHIFEGIYYLEPSQDYRNVIKDNSEKPRFNPIAGVYKPEYNDIIPAYCSGFKSYIGYRLSTCKPVEVGEILDNKFPRPDETDCDYLTDILSEVEIEVSQGLGYDPGQCNGIDIYMPAEPVIHANLKTAARWVIKARTHVDEVRTYTPRAPRKDTVEQMAPAQTTTRPNTILGRVEAAQKTYQDTLEYFKKQGKSRDFTVWELDITLPDGSQKTLHSDQLIPPYCRQFPTALGYVLTHTEVKYVAEVMDFHFPNPDKLDCDYLTDVLNEIEGILNVGYLFSPKAQDGIDYYCGFKNDSEMFHASLDGIDTSNTRHKEASEPVIERAKKWLTGAEAMSFAKLPPVGPDSRHSEITPPSTPPVASSLLTELPGLKWEKRVADIGELFYRLAKGGFIDLREYREPNAGNLSALCRHICRLFQVPPDRSKDAAVALKAIMNTLLRGDTMEPGPVDEQLLWKKPLDRRPGNNASARVAAVIPKENSVGES